MSSPGLAMRTGLFTIDTSEPTIESFIPAITPSEAAMSMMPLTIEQRESYN